MKTIIVKAFNVFDEKTETFLSVEKDTKIRLENSLYAITEWEKKYKRPWFPDKKASESARKKYEEQKTPEEMLYFIKSMIRYVDDVLVIDISDIPDSLVYGLSADNFKEIQEYLGDPQTALRSIPETKPDKKSKGDQIRFTSDRIYAWMVEQQIPFEAQYWNINRLLNLVQIVNYDNTPDDKKKRAKPYEIAQDYARINEERLKASGKKG
jgi:hypothetical protein